VAEQLLILISINIEIDRQSNDTVYFRQGWTFYYEEADKKSGAHSEFPNQLFGDPSALCKRKFSAHAQSLDPLLLKKMGRFLDQLQTGLLNLRWNKNQEITT